MTGRLTFGKRERLRRSDDIGTVIRTGRRSSGDGIALTFLDNGGQATRAAFVTRRALGPAPLRNTMKRRMRECYRAVKHRVRPGADIVLSAARETDSRTIGQALGALLERLALLRNAVDEG